MTCNSNTKLHILGKVSSSVVKKINHPEFKDNQVWLFVGYNFRDYKVGQTFDILIDNSTNKWNHDFKLKLEKVVDEYGVFHDQMPDGFKTICLFDCNPHIPDNVCKLPSLETWDFSAEGIYLCDHDDIDLLNPIQNNTVIFETLVDLITMELLQQNKETFTFQDIEHLVPNKIPSIIINNLILSGNIIQRSDKRLELAHKV